MQPYVIDGQTLCLPMASPLITNRFGHDDTLSETVQDWAERSGLGPVAIELGCYLRGNDIVACRYVYFDRLEDAMIFKLRWL